MEVGEAARDTQARFEGLVDEQGSGQSEPFQHRAGSLTDSQDSKDSHNNDSASSRKPDSR